VTELLVRPLTSDAEIDAYFRLAAGTFSSHADPAGQGPAWRARELAAPWYRPEQLRGAFHDGALVGGYLISERWLRIGQARLLTGCIGGVVVREEARKQGVGRALMDDAITFAEENRHALLLLDGIPNFYHRFGYADVFDPTSHAFKRSDALALGPGPYRVRPATRQDAEPLLDLYLRHVAAFDRTLEEQRWRLPEGEDERPDLVAVDGGGAVRGYMLAARGEARDRVGEVAADDWPAALALLRHHAESSAADELRWDIPPTAPLLYWLIDRFNVTSTTARVHRGYWMARPGHMPTLLAAAGLPAEVAALDPTLLVQLLFGFRPAELVDPSLARLFPFGRFWIPASDNF
jgi:GNAT superfamily N-acetyltransferase